MRIICDYCGQVMLDRPLSYYDRHQNRDVPVDDKDVHATIRHSMGMVTVEIHDEVGHGVGGAMHEHPEIP